MQHIICFGEVLWDLLPSGKQAGGAPMNVAFRLKEFQQNVKLISAIGKDSLGDALYDLLHLKGLEKDLHRSEQLPTGTVNVILDAKGNAQYTIVEGVAWEEIAITNFSFGPIQLIFGSLALRSEFNRNQIQLLIKEAQEIIFDVNLRSPYYDFELINTYIHKSQVIKLNEEEFNWVCTQHSIAVSFTENCFNQLALIYTGKTWCVTRGEHGAVLFESGKCYFAEGIPVKVKDTIGAGDAFLAAFLYKRNLRENPFDCLKFACQVGAVVAGQHGATQALPAAFLPS